jgi:hypothetical protein
MAQLYFGGGRDSVPSQALRNFDNMGQRDAENKRHAKEIKLKYAEGKRLSALDMYKADLIAKGEDNRSQRLKDAEFERSRALMYTSDTQRDARFAEARALSIGPTATANRLGWKQEREFKAADALREGKQVDRSIAAIQEILQQSASAKNPNDPMYQKALVDTLSRLDETYARQDKIWDAPSQYRQQIGDSPVVSTRLTPTNQGIVSQGLTEDGGTVEKTTFAERGENDGDITYKSVEQQGYLAMLKLVARGGTMPQIFMDQSNRLAQDKDNATRNRSEIDQVPISGNPQWTGGTAAPAEGTAAPAEGAAGELGVISPDDAIELSNAGGGGYTPQTIEALSKFFVARNNSGPGSQEAIGAASDAEQAINEDPATIANDTVDGMGDWISKSSDTVLNANERVNLRGATEAVPSEDQARFRLQSIMGGLTDQSLRDKPVGQMTPEERANFYGAPAEGEYAQPQQQQPQQPPRVRSLQGDAAPADRPLVPTSMAGWKEDIVADLRGIGSSIRGRLGQSGIADKPMIGGADAAIVPASQQPQQASVPAPEEEGPSFAERAQGAGEAIKSAVGGYIEKQKARPQGPGPGEDKTTAFEKIQKANANAYAAGLVPTKAELADVVMTGMTSSPFTDKTRSRPQEGTTSDPYRDALAAARLRERGGPDADRMAQAALGGERFSLRGDVAKHQLNALDYDTSKKIGADQGNINSPTSQRTVASPRDGNDFNFASQIGVAVDDVRQQSAGVRDNAQLRLIQKKLKKEGVPDFKPTSTGNLITLVDNVYHSSPTETRNYVARVAKAFGAKGLSDDISTWPPAYQKELTQLVIADLSTPSWWNRISTGFLRKIPLTKWDDRPPGQAPGQTAKGDKVRAEQMDREGLRKIEKVTGLNALNQ